MNTRFGDKISWLEADTTWSELNEIWGLVREVVKVVGSSPYKRKERLEQFLDNDPEKKKKLIHLICRIEGVKVYDDSKEIESDIEITIENIEMLAEKVLGKTIKVENPNVV